MTKLIESVKNPDCPHETAAAIVNELTVAKHVISDAKDGENINSTLTDINYALDVLMGNTGCMEKLTPEAHAAIPPLRGSVKVLESGNGLISKLGASIADLLKKITDDIAPAHVENTLQNPSADYVPHRKK